MTRAESTLAKTITTNAPVIFGLLRSTSLLRTRFTVARFRWIIAALLLVSTLINYTDRVTLSVLIGNIQRDLGLNEVDYSQVLAIFLFSYAAMYAISGYVVDRFGTRRGFAMFALGWSVSQILHGAIVGKWSLAG